MEAKTETLQVVGTMCRKKPFYAPLAAVLLEEIQAFFQDPEGEKEFQEWMRNRREERIEAEGRAE